MDGSELEAASRREDAETRIKSETSALGTDTVFSGKIYTSCVHIPSVYVINEPASAFSMDSGNPTAGGPAPWWRRPFSRAPPQTPEQQLQELDALFERIMSLEIGAHLDGPAEDDPMDDEINAQMDEDSAGSASEDDDAMMLEFEPVDEEEAAFNAFVRGEILRSPRTFRLKVLMMCLLMCTKIGNDFFHGSDFGIFNMTGSTSLKSMHDSPLAKSTQYPKPFTYSKVTGNLTESFQDVAESSWLMFDKREDSTTNHTTYNYTSSVGKAHNVTGTQNEAESKRRQLSKSTPINVSLLDSFVKNITRL